MGRGPDCFWPLGLPPTGRGRFMVSLCGSLARSRRLDFVGRRILCEKALAAEMVSCKLDSQSLLLRTCPRNSHSVTLDNFGFGVSYPELDNSHLNLLTGRCSADENE